jgi:hypothetical protein
MADLEVRLPVTCPFCDVAAQGIQNADEPDMRTYICGTRYFGESGHSRNGVCIALEVRRDQRDTYQELLRQVVMDYGPAEPCPDACMCSANRARKVLADA